MSVSYRKPGRVLQREGRVTVVRDINLEVATGQIVALVGESGSGKSTTARAILRLIEPDSGSIRCDGVDIRGLSRRQLREQRRHMQMVFQDPYSSLNPLQAIGDAIGEPLHVHDGVTGGELRRRVAELLGLVGLDASAAGRRPDQFSGGQRQRIVIARALATQPRLLICDEAVSALDVSTQHQILELLAELRERLGLAILFITHDLAVVRHLAERVAVMYLGQVVETGPTARVLSDPVHPYTRALLSSVVVASPWRQKRRQRIELSGEIGDPASPPSGCSFHPRCPEALPVCTSESPVWTPLRSGGAARCHLLTPVTIGEGTTCSAS